MAATTIGENNITVSKFYNKSDAVSTVCGDLIVCLLREKKKERYSDLLYAKE